MKPLSRLKVNKKLKTDFPFGKNNPHLRLQMNKDTVVVQKELDTY